jgi:predicted enzyme related to lactoylglutathione lyase
MEVLSSRVLLAPSDLAAAIRWYGEVLGLRVFREYGTGGLTTGIVYFLGGGYLELTGSDAGGPAGAGVSLWLQVPDLAAEHARLAAAGATVLQPPARMPWGLDECWIADPDGTRLCLVEVPVDHPMRTRLQTG